MSDGGARDWSGNEELRLDAAEMRRLGYLAIDAVVEHMTTLADRPVSRTASRRELEARLRETPPAKPTHPEAVLEAALRDVLSDVIHVDHPRNFGFVPGPSNFIGVIGDLLASGFNVFAGTWLEASGPAQVEIVTLDWLKSLCGFPEAASGLFVSGGSAANLTGLAVAREEKLVDDLGRGVAYYSDQTHSSVERALRVLGLRHRQLRKLASDADLRLSVGALEGAIASDRRAGARPFLVVANAGTTNTGAVDPLPRLVELCRREDLWLHVDGAYGAAAAFTDRGKRLLRGLGDVDSLSLDPHKWLFQPYEAGTVLVREGALLKKHFHILPSYLEDVQAGEEEVNFCDLGIQLTRSFRALKLWMTVRVFGLDHLRRAVERGLDLAERAEALLHERGEFEVLAPGKLGIVAFRFVSPRARDLDGINRRLAKAVIEDGFALVSSTVIHGKTALRMCPINPRTTEEDLVRTLDRIGELAAEIEL